MSAGKLPDRCTDDAVMRHCERLPVASAADAALPSGLWVWPLPSLRECRPVVAKGCRLWPSQDERIRRCCGADIIYERGSQHDARPCRMSDGVPALAVSDGTVALTRWSGPGFSIVIRHPNGWATYYAPLERLSVSADEVLAAGQPMGFIRSDPIEALPVAHLHFELWRHGRRAGATDPRPHLASWRCLDLIDWSPPRSSQPDLVHSL